MSRIVLFYPRVGVKAGLVPAGLLMIAGRLLENDFKVKVIDQRYDKDWREELIRELKKEPLMVGFTVMTGKQILEALAVSGIVKERSRTKVVWGGVHASLLPEQTLENQKIDFVVLGEGEETFLELALALREGSDFKAIKGLGYRVSEEIVYTWRDDFVDLDGLPILPYHLVNIENYIVKKSRMTGKTAREMALFTSRGCPYRCGFCYNMKFNRRHWRAMSPERIIKEMEFLITNYGVNVFNIQDDEFFIDLKRVEELCRLIKERGFEIEICSEARVNQTACLMSDDLLGDLKNCGFLEIVFGVETGSQRILELIHKDITYEQVIKTIEKLKAVGILSKYCFMAGFPGETVSDFFKTTDLIYKMKSLDSNIRIPPVRIFTPYPGIPLWDDCLRNGFKPPRSLEEWAEYDFSRVKMPWLEKNFGKIIENVNMMLDYLKLEPKFSSKFKYKLSLIFSRWIDWRWRHHFFRFFPEKYLLKLIRR